MPVPLTLVKDARNIYSSKDITLEHYGRNPIILPSLVYFPAALGLIPKIAAASFMDKLSFVWGFGLVVGSSLKIEDVDVSKIVGKEMGLEIGTGAGKGDDLAIPSFKILLISVMGD